MDLKEQIKHLLSEKLQVEDLTMLNNERRAGNKFDFLEYTNCRRLLMDVLQQYHIVSCLSSKNVNISNRVFKESSAVQFVLKTLVST